MDDDTRQLVERARSGDSLAFERLVADHRDALTNAVRARLRQYRMSGIDPDDVVQETFTIAVGKIDGFRWEGSASFLRWLLGISRRIVLASSRRKRPTVDLGRADAVVAPDPSPSRALRREERLERLEHSLSSLSPDHRQVILLSRIDGLTTNEIAARMGRSPAAVKQLLWRALRQLRETFGETESLGLPDRRPGETTPADGEEELP